MLLHNYLQQKAGILAEAQAKINSLLSGISDPKMKEAVEGWKLGDPITDNYPQVDQKKEEPTKAEDTHGEPQVIPESAIASLAPIDPIIPPVVTGPSTAIPDAAIGGENTNHTI